MCSTRTVCRHWRNHEYKYHFTYIIRNTINGKYYKGAHSTNNLKDGYMGGGAKLKAAIKEYGRSAFVMEIVAFYATIEDVFRAEHEFITEEDINSDMCYNMQYGGLRGHRHTEQEKANASVKTTEWFKTHEHPLAGKHWTDETRERFMATMNTPEHKAKARLAKLGSNNPMYGRTGENNHTSKAVLCVELNKVYGSAMLAAKEHGCSFQNISKVCKGERHTCAGYHWKFVE